MREEWIFLTNNHSQFPAIFIIKIIPAELVLGYFQVSAVEPKSIYITPDELTDLESSGLSI